MFDCGSFCNTAEIVYLIKGSFVSLLSLNQLFSLFKGHNRQTSALFLYDAYVSVCSWTLGWAGNQLRNRLSGEVISLSVKYTDMYYNKYLGAL